MIYYFFGLELMTVWTLLVGNLPAEELLTSFKLLPADLLLTEVVTVELPCVSGPNLPEVCSGVYKVRYCLDSIFNSATSFS
jgi:hypothetical protein